MTTYPKDFVESVRGYILTKATTLFKQQEKLDQLLLMETWDPIFEKINYELRYYSDIEEEPNESLTELMRSINLHTLYPSETYNDYIQRIGSLQRLGAYDYTEFYRKLKDPEFKQCIKQTYKKIEKIKKIKQKIVLYVLTTLGHITTEIEPIHAINIIPVFEYISKKNIYCSNLHEEPLYKHFRSNKEQFYEMYTLWAIKNV
jgi:hypothetical protein